MARSAVCESIKICPFGCIDMLEVPEVIVLRVLEYPLSSANGAFTEITYNAIDRSSYFFSLFHEHNLPYSLHGTRYPESQLGVVPNPTLLEKIDLLVQRFPRPSLVQQSTSAIQQQLKRKLELEQEFQNAAQNGTNLLNAL